LTGGTIRRIVVIGHGTAAVAGSAVADAIESRLKGSGIRVEAKVASELSGFALEKDLHDTLVILVADHGECFGEGGLIENHEASLFGARYHCDAICTRAGRCLQLPANALRHCLTNNPNFAMEWIATLSRSLRRQRAAQERLGLKSLRMRVIHYLVDRGVEGRVELDQPILRWAVELGASHEALYRTLAEMEREGVLQRQGQTLTLSQR